MTFNSLRQTVYSAINKQTFSKEDDETRTLQKIIAGALLYSTLESLLNSNSSYSGKISELASNYALTYKNIVEGLPNKYVSYKELIKKTKEYGISSFIQITKKQINELTEIYKNKQEIECFSPISYSPFMYGIYSATEVENNRMRKLHFAVFAPIAKYYKTQNNINYSSMTFENYLSSNPGKCVNISINGISSIKLYADIKADIFCISDYIFKTEITSDGFVRITTN